MPASFPTPELPGPGDYVLLCDKPPGVTSHDVVAAIRRGLPRRTKVGHAGTLDPFATGLLLLLVGRATRVQRFLMELPKRYEAVARFGAVSSTGDPEGEITVTGEVPRGDLELPVGRLRQRPPVYSAVKVAGRRAYVLARAGEPVELAEREVVVHAFRELWREGERRAFAIECSSGTYVRSLIAELGDAYCLALRRTGIGPFSVKDADAARPLGLREALAFLPAVELDAEQARRARHGAAVEAGPVGEGAAVVRLEHAGALIALAAPGPRPGTLRPVVGLAGP